MKCPHCGEEQLHERIHRPRVTFPPSSAAHKVEVRYMLCHGCHTPTVTPEQALANDESYASAMVTADTAARARKRKSK